MSRRERKQLILAKQVANRLMGDVKYPPGTIVYIPSQNQYGKVEVVAPFKHLPYMVKGENGDVITFSESGMENNYVSRTKYKKDVRRRRKAGLKVNSLI